MCSIRSCNMNDPPGGLQQADVPGAQVQTLHAKVAAIMMLLHPRRRSWKLLMQRAFERCLPALVSSLAAANAPGRSPRHVGYRLAGFLSVEAAQAAGASLHVTASAPACGSGLPAIAASLSVGRVQAWRLLHSGCGCCTLLCSVLAASRWPGPEDRTEQP
jgi:hypothetical protein